MEGGWGITRSKCVLMMKLDEGLVMGKGGGRGTI